MLVAPLLLLLVAQPPASPIDTRSAVLSRIHALCPSVAAMDRGALLAEERRVTREGGGGNRMYPGQVFKGAGWLQAGCLRATLSFLDPPPKANWGVVLPEPWANLAIDALVSGLNQHPEHPIGSALLAAVAIDATESPKKPVPELYEDIAQTLARSASAGVRTASVLRGCAAFEMAISDTTVAHLCIRYALAAGVDSTWHLLRLAWIDARHGDTLFATQELQLAVAAARDSASRGELEATLGSGVTVTKQNAIALLHGIAPNGLNLRTCTPVGASPECSGTYLTRGMHSLAMFAGMSRLWNPSNGQPIGLVTYALNRNDLVSPTATSIQLAAAAAASAVPAGSGGGFVEPRPTLPNSRASILFHQWDAEHGTLMTRGATIEDLSGGYNNHGYATGYLFVSSQEAVRSWSVTAGTPFGGLERHGVDDLAPLDTGPLAISDPILGAARDQVTWKTGGKIVTLSPMNAIYRGDPVYLYYQVKSDAARPALTTTMLFYREDQVDAGTPLLQVQFKTPVDAGLNELQHELDVSRLAAGAYRLVILAEDAGRNESSRQSRRVMVK